MKKSSLVFLTLIAAFVLTGSATADVRLDEGDFDEQMFGAGRNVVATSTFRLSGPDIPRVGFLFNFDLIDEGLEIIINGQEFFSAPDIHQGGDREFEEIAGMYNDIQNPWNENSNSLPRLIVEAGADGTDFTGAVTVGANTLETYVPLFDVADLQSVLREGDNTIDFINLNGDAFGRLVGDYQVFLVAIPEPHSAGLLLGVLAACGLRRKRK